MNLRSRISDDLKTSLKAGDSVRVSVLRMVLAAIKNLEIDKNLKEVPETEVAQIIKRQVKQHKDSIEQFQKGNRQELADKEREELRILESYIPKEMNRDEIISIAKDAINELGAKSKADTGTVMKAVMSKTAGRADGKVVNEVVSELLK